MIRRSAIVAGALLVLAWAGPSRAEDPLRVCLDRRNAAVPAADSGAPRNFDLAVGQALARKLERPLAVQWYESGMDRDVDPAAQMNALLSDGRCQLVLGYPLFAGVLDMPQAQRSRLPDFDGAIPADRRRWVQLGEVAASRGYRFDPMVVVLGPGAASRTIHSLGDLRGMRLVVEESSLADAILMTYGNGALIGQITHMIPGQDLFGSLEHGEQDATLVELHRLDAYVAQHPDSGLSSSGHYHSIGFNIGIIGLARDTSLMAAVNAGIGDMLDKHEFQALAGTASLTWLPPREPNVGAPITNSALRGD